MSPSTDPPGARPAAAPTALRPVVFPASITDPRAGRWWRQRARIVMSGTVLVVLVAGGGAWRQASASPTDRYRTAVVAEHPVDTVLTSVATLEPVSLAAVAFPSAGTVATVDVAVDTRVTAGQTLATLDPTDLTDALDQKQTALTQAQTTLADLQRGTTTSSSTSSASTGTSTGTSGGTAAPGGGTAAAAGGSATAGAAGAGAASAGTSSAGASSATSIASAEQAVVRAQADVTVAQQALIRATIVSPIAGTVVAVHLTPGEQVAAASASATVDVMGDGGLEASTTIAVDDVKTVKVGQPASIVPDGSTTPLPGTVAAIPVAPDPSSSTTTYRVVIRLDDPHAAVGIGSTGSVSITTAQVPTTLAVPTSAVTTLGDQHTVTVFDGTTTSTTRVQIGAIGATWTQVTSGVTAGQQVVLADLDQPLPSSATTATTGSNNRSGFGPPGAGIGGFPAGGPPSGAAPGR